MLPCFNQPCQRVLARHQNRRFYPASVECWRRTPAGELLFTVMLDDGCKEVNVQNINGSGFTNLNANTALVYGQRVLVTINGTQQHQTGTVMEHKQEQVYIKLDSTGEILVRNIADVRLSALPPPSHFGTATDHSIDSIISFKNFKPKPHIQDINVPLRKEKRPEKRLILSEYEDIKTAALALTSLSLSPAPLDGFAKENGTSQSKFVFPPSSLSEHESADSRLTTNDEGYNDVILKPRSRSFDTIREGSPSLPAEYGRPRASSLNDMAPFEEHSGRNSPCSDNGTPSFKRKAPKAEKTKKMFRCMWRGCDRILTSLPGIMRHVKTAHLGPETDDRVEFYFDDVFVDADMAACSDDSSVSSGIVEDSRSLIGSDGEESDGCPLSPKMPALSPSSETDESEYFVPRRPKQNHEKVEKTPLSKVATGRVRPRARQKSIGEASKKCRKVYGMEQRHLWCTQCRWKKACVRFVE